MVGDNIMEPYDVDKRIRAEINLFKQELGTENFELKEEQKIMALLERTKTLVQNICNILKNMGPSLSGLLGGTVRLYALPNRIDGLIRLLKKDEKAVWAIEKETDMQIAEATRDNSMHAFKIVRNIENNKLQLTKEHEQIIHELRGELFSLIPEVYYETRGASGKTLSAGRLYQDYTSRAKPALQSLVETIKGISKILQQLDELADKELAVINMEKRGM